MRDTRSRSIAAAVLVLISILVSALSACRAPEDRLGAGSKPGWGRVGGFDAERKEQRSVPGASAPSLPATERRGPPGWGRVADRVRR